MQLSTKYGSDFQGEAGACLDRPGIAEWQADPVKPRHYLSVSQTTPTMGRQAGTAARWRTRQNGNCIATTMGGMLKLDVATGPRGRVVIMGSITQATDAEAGCLVVSASHGGVSSAEYALAVPLALAVFNDAGVGKDSAGIAALGLLQAHGRAALAVGHTSARIGDAQDSWDNGVVSHVNDAARGLGLQPGDRLNEALRRLVGA